MKVNIQLAQEFPTVPGYFRVVVSWKHGKTGRVCSSNVLSSDTPPEMVAEALRGLGYRILESASRHPLSKSLSPES